MIELGAFDAAVAAGEQLSKTGVVTSIVTSLIVFALASMAVLKWMTGAGKNITADRAEVYGIKMIRQDNKDLRLENEDLREQRKILDAHIRHLENELGTVRGEFKKLEGEFRKALNHIARIEKLFKDSKGKIPDWPPVEDEL